MQCSKQAASSLDADGRLLHPQAAILVLTTYPRAPLPAGTRLPTQRRPQPGLTSWCLALGPLVFAWLELCNKLRVDWSANYQYQYGWFVPPLTLALLALRWADRPAAAPAVRPPGWALALLASACLLLLWPVRLTEEPNPDWRLLFWLHAGLLLALSLALLAWAGGWPWVRHFAFPLGFLLLAVPWPSGPEQAIVQSLMRVVAAISAQGMNLLGIPAQAQGNLIHLREQTVGVDEACSGIRSLQTMLMGGLLLGELSRLHWTRRLALLAGGLVIAMVANVFRCSLLVWISASYGTAAFDRFHDLAGVSVLLIVFAGLLWLNRRLARGQRPPASSGNAEGRGASTAAAKLVPLGLLVPAAIWLLAIEVGTAAWYNLGAPAGNVLPAWTVVPPATAPGFRNVKIDDRSRRLLRYDRGLSATWSHPGIPDDQCTLFFFRWEPGHASAAQAEMHQPHICLTASGLTQIADWGIEPVRLPDGMTLPVRRYAFGLNGRTIYVFFVVWQDRAGAPPLPDTPGSRWDRFQAVLEHRPDLGRQTLEFIVSGPATAAEASAQFAHDAAMMVHPLAPVRL